MRITQRCSILRASSTRVALVAISLAAGACDGQPEPSSPVAATTDLKGASSDSNATGPSGSGKMSTLAASVPQPKGGDIINTAAAVRLGKAIFWDEQAGGDGHIACASCHFHSGADNRVINVLNPGPDGLFASGGVSAAGQTFSAVSIVNDDRVGSQGIVGAIFSGLDPDPSVAADQCAANQVAPYYTARRVTGRNTPSVIAAIFNRDNFWDGRANHEFNGLNPFGGTGNGGGTLSVGNSSLASQAVGPPNNDTEMSCAGRTFNGAGSLGAKLLARIPLGHQHVDPTDSVLGSMAAPGNGLTVSYQNLIDAAFAPALAADSLNQFSRIWGQAVQAYEATLIPDQTPYDRFLAGNGSALNESQKKGLDRFTGKGGCINCHAGAELSDASISFAAAQGLLNEDGGDQGFHNLGVRPTADDPGRAGCPSAPCDSSGPGHFPNSASGSVKDRGAFKTAALRNVKLTAPYFHNGGKSTLADVVAFYNRGGDFANPEKAKRIKPLSLDAGDQAALVDFLTNGLTDCRVENERAPFDHPSLAPANGAALPAVGANGKGICP
jgi:cytochrome c peroxidase